MAQNFAELTQLFREALSQRFGLLSDGLPEAGRLYFSLGTPLPDDGFRTEDGSAYFPLRAMEFMSHHCNVAPRLVGDSYFATINQVDELYGLLLKGSSPISAADVDLFGAVKTEAKAEFDTEIGSTIPPGFDTFRPTHIVPELWFDQTQSGNWTTMSIEHAPKNRMPNLIGLPADPVISLLACVNLEDVDHCLNFLSNSLTPLGDGARGLGEFFFTVTRSGAQPDVRGDASQAGSVVKSQVPAAGVEVAPNSTFTIEVSVPPSSGSSTTHGGGLGSIVPDGLASPFHMMFRPVDPRLVEVLSEPLSVKSVRRIRSEADLGLIDNLVENPSLNTQFIDQSMLSNAVVAVTLEPGQFENRPERPLPDALARAIDVDVGLARSASSTIRAEELFPGDQLFRDFPAAIRVDAIAFTDGVQVTSHSFRLDADVCFVTFRRPWMSSAFLQLKNWFVQSFKQGELAQGGNLEDGSPLAAIATGCVLIRNLRISAEWTSTDQTQSLMSTHIGPFSLLGRSFDTTTATLSVPGMQSVAWLCQPMPTLPPQPSPT